MNPQDKNSSTLPHGSIATNPLVDSRNQPPLQLLPQNLDSSIQQPPFPQNPVPQFQQQFISSNTQRQEIPGIRQIPLSSTSESYSNFNRNFTPISSNTNKNDQFLSSNTTNIRNQYQNEQPETSISSSIPSARNKHYHPRPLPPVRDILSINLSDSDSFDENSSTDSRFYYIILFLLC